MVDRIKTEPPMELALVDLELAKAAKKQGFNEPTYNRFIKEKEDQLDEYNKFFTTRPEDMVMRPTLELLRKWIREVLDIHVDIYRSAIGWQVNLEVAECGTHICKVTEDEEDDYDTACAKGCLAAVTRMLYHTFTEDTDDGVFARYYLVKDYTMEEALQSLSNKYPGVTHKYLGEGMLHSVNPE